MSFRFRRTLITANVLAAAVVGGVIGTGSGAGVDASPAAEPMNLSVAKQQVRDYYGDRVDETGHHHHSNDSKWAHDVDRVITRAQRDLARRMVEGAPNPTITLDIDDTAEVSYGFQADHDFGSAQPDSTFPPVERVVRLTRWAKENGIGVYFITSRPDYLTRATAAGLAEDGYPEPDGLFLKPTEHAPDYLPCGIHCSTVEFKSATRRHLESLGNTVLGNFGDQLSDLEGGHSERNYKLPNPMFQ